MLHSKHSVLQLARLFGRSSYCWRYDSVNQTNTYQKHTTEKLLWVIVCRAIENHGGGRKTILLGPYHNLDQTEKSCHLSSAEARAGAWRLHHAWQMGDLFDTKLSKLKTGVSPIQTIQIFLEWWRPQTSRGSAKLSHPSQWAWSYANSHCALWVYYPWHVMQMFYSFTVAIWFIEN